MKILCKKVAVCLLFFISINSIAQDTIKVHFNKTYTYDYSFKLKVSDFDNCVWLYARKFKILFSIKDTMLYLGDLDKDRSTALGYKSKFSLTEYLAIKQDGSKIDLINSWTKTGKTKIIYDEKVFDYERVIAKGKRSDTLHVWVNEKPKNPTKPSTISQWLTTFNLMEGIPKGAAVVAFILNDKEVGTEEFEEKTVYESLVFDTSKFVTKKSLDALEEKRKAREEASKPKNIN